MMVASVKIAALLVCFVGGAAAWAPARQSADLTRLLQRAGAYLAGYEREISMVVSEELYTQNTRESGGPPQTRILKSDILMADLGPEGWFGVRDIFEVDGQPVRDHQNRLLELVTSPAPDMLTKARQYADEGARFNIGSVQRTLNLPTFALTFLRASSQSRSTWTLGSRKKINDHDTIELRFVEQATPRVIETRDNAPAAGRFWVESDSARVVRAELLLDSGGMNAVITVTFGPAPSITPWVPLVMDEVYRASNIRNRSATQGDTFTRANEQAGSIIGVIDGHATYRNFRAFNVQSNYVIRKF
jgi:hypothetical protein